MSLGDATRGVNALVRRLLAIVTVSGCLDPSPSPDSPSADPAASPTLGDVLMTRHDCAGFNAIFFVDTAALAPYVPANWTFAAFQNQGMGLRQDPEVAR